MGVFQMMHKVFNFITSNTVATPSHIQHAVAKMDRTIDRMDNSQHVQLFKTDYLE
ncbi:hypothetical protein [Acinetobacter cumulans]|uniref:hypothetical protein n=1 Tax=Acinetobacter cumulans TaxID=2136182 RepID=UPI00148DC596|nr:hypothetical protein [Acinetobacter cumulans]